MKIKITPVAVSAFVTLIFEAVVVLFHEYIHLRTPENILLGVLVFVSTLAVELYRERKKLKSIGKHIQGLQEIGEQTPKHIREYIDHSLSAHIRAFQSLAKGDTFACPYADQIAIADDIARDVSERFWATSLDKPSRLWIEGVDYFATLERILPNVQYNGNASQPPKKARIVIQNLPSLLEDYTLQQASFKNFIDWHAKNQWGLRFYLVSNEAELDHLVQNIVFGDDDPLKDFLIKDHLYIYGRIKEQVNRVYLKFIQNKSDTTATIESYEKLFRTLWAQSSEPSTVVQKIDAERQREIIRTEIRRSYDQDFAICPAGLEFFKAVCKKIENPAAKVVAVDVADFKEGVSVWSARLEYQSFLASSITASKNSKQVQRIYVLNSLSTLKLPLVKTVMLKQLSANVSLCFLTRDQCQDSNIDPEDFIVVDQDFCFYLGNSNFKIDLLHYLKNLVPKAQITYYSELFESLWNITQAKVFTGTADIQKFTALIQ